MQYSNEIKVGVAIIVAAIVFFVGLRFFQDLPIFQGSYTLHAKFEDAGGLVSGNPVRMKGVSVGTVQSVTLNQSEQMVDVRFRVEDDVAVPSGSYAKVTGFSALSGVRLTIIPGPASNTPLASGATLPGPPEGGLLERLSDQAPELASKADSVLTGANTTFDALNQQLANPSSDLRQTIRALEQTMRNVSELTGDENAALRQTLSNLEAITADLEGFTGTDTDTLQANNLGQTMKRLNAALARLETNLATLETTTTNLNALTTKMNEGDGTIGRLVNDPSLYVRLDTTAARANQILLDLKQNPGRYLNDMTLVKVF